MRCPVNHALPPHDNPCINNRGGMPQITLIGINHKTAPVALREILSFTGDEADIALHRLFQKPEIGELVTIFHLQQNGNFVYPSPGDGQDCVKTFLSQF